MPNLRACNRVRLPTTVRTLATVAQMSGPVSLRELMKLLGSGGVPRPFYVCGHNTNTIEEVRTALKEGANALEPDVNFYSPLVSDREGELCISHDLGSPKALALVPFLDELHQIALDNPQLALIVFDCKIMGAKHGRTLLDAIRTHLTHDTNLNVIISVGELSQKSFFDQIQTERRPREGLMIDMENDPAAVSAFFTDRGVTHQGYGNGITPAAATVLTATSPLSQGVGLIVGAMLGPNVRPSLEKACALRAAHDKIRFIYAWTINDRNAEKEYIRIGVDGMISDDIAEVVEAMKAFPGVIRLATRDDNPFLPPNAGYALTIHTTDETHAGTDARVTFTLTGANGSVSKTVDTWLRGRMEAGQTNYVTIHCADLGALQSISVKRNDAGNAPDWKLGWVKIESARYGVNKSVDFNRMIGTSAITRSL